MNQIPGDDRDKNGTSMTRIAIWLVVGGFGAYLLIAGIIGILTG